MFTFSKQERLCSHTLIDALYQKGHRFMAFPYSVTWLVAEGAEGPRCQVLIVAPKRKLPHAVDRNKAKRHTRELYRLNKPRLYAHLEQKNLRLLLSISYIHTSVLPHAKMAVKFDRMLDELLTQTL